MVPAPLPSRPQQAGASRALPAGQPAAQHLPQYAGMLQIEISTKFRVSFRAKKGGNILLEIATENPRKVKIYLSETISLFVDRKYCKIS